MNAPALTQETTHGNLPLQRYLASLALYSQNLSTGYIVGEKIYVNGDSTGGDGTSWEKAFPTFAEAVAALSDDDVIFLAPGSYNEGETHVITENNVKIIGVMNAPGIASGAVELRSYHGAGAEGDEDILRYEGNNLEIAGIRFLPGSGYWAIKAGASTDPSDLWVHDCYFYGAAIGSCHGVQMGRRDGSAGNAVSALVENNVFYKLGTAINLDASRGQVKRNTLVMTHTRTGITCPQSGSQRNSNEIVDNRFVSYGTPCDAYGINFTGATSPTVGSMWVDGNKFINFSSATNAVNKLSGYGGLNWYNNDILENTNPPTQLALS